MPVKVSIEVALTPAQAAALFCAWSDEQQAQFFIECAAIGERWRTNGGSPELQWSLVGGHLRTCACSSDEARAMVKAIAAGVHP